MARNARDHGGGLDAAIATFGGNRSDWVDLSTGINPRAFAVPRSFSDHAWTCLPDDRADHELITAARTFWNIPNDAAVLAVPGCSAAIAQIPHLHAKGTVEIAGPTYNEHAASFEYAGWSVKQNAPQASARVIVHPNNPTGTFHTDIPATNLTIIDESFCDIDLSQSMICRANQPDHLILKSFGKFWGLAGLRLGFAVGDPRLLADLKARLGPWPVSGPAMEIGIAALQDTNWADETRGWLNQQISALDHAMKGSGSPLGQTSLFRTYEVADAKALQTRLAQGHVWSRVFPYSKTWIRLGVPDDRGLAYLKAAL